MNNDMTAAERMDDWVDEWACRGHDWDFAQWVAQSLEGHLEAIERIVGSEVAAKPLRELLETAAMGEGFRPETWQEAMEGIGATAATEWNMGLCFLELGLYGIYGATREEIPVAEREARIETCLAEAEAFVHAAGYDRPGATDGAQTLAILRVARARRALDTGEGGVDPASMAVLGGWSEGRVRNMMSGADRAFENEGGRIPAEAALAALRDRPAFFHSIWSRADDAPPPQQSSLETPLFVPEARDGTRFHPGLKHRGTFTIGAKGKEITLDDFDEALSALHRMPEPEWHRPNAAGNWGPVKGVAWVRTERSELLAT